MQQRTIRLFDGRNAGGGVDAIGELAAVDQLLSDPTIVAPLLTKLDPVRG